MPKQGKPRQNLSTAGKGKNFKRAGGSGRKKNTGKFGKKPTSATKKPATQARIRGGGRRQAPKGGSMYTPLILVPKKKKK